MRNLTTESPSAIPLDEGRSGQNSHRKYLWLFLLLALLMALLFCLAQTLEGLQKSDPPALCTRAGIDRDSAAVLALSEILLKTPVAASCGHLDAPFDLLGLDVHTGLDFPQTEGTPVYAATAGWVEKTSTLTGQIAVRLSDQRLLNYFHLETLAVSENSPVKKGQYLGTVGIKGIATGPHLHIEVRVNYAGSAGLAGVSCGGRCSLEQVAAMTQNPVVLLAD